MSRLLCRMMSIEKRFFIMAPTREDELNVSFLESWLSNLGCQTWGVVLPCDNYSQKYIWEEQIALKRPSSSNFLYTIITFSCLNRWQPLELILRRNYTVFSKPSPYIPYTAISYSLRVIKLWITRSLSPYTLLARPYQFFLFTFICYYEKRKYFCLIHYYTYFKKGNQSRKNDN